MTIFGVHTNIQNKSFEDLYRLWTLADDLGFHWISGSDHFPGSVGRTSHEATAMHASIASFTRRPNCAILCYSVGFRHPVVLAGAAATVDQLSHGRAAIGLGSGSVPKDFEIYGLPPLSLRERTDQLEEAVACVAGLLREDTFSFDGRYYQINGGRNVRPVQSRLPVIIGTGGERRGLRMVARYADGWNLGGATPAEFARKRQVLEKHCSEIGRDMREITCSANLVYALGADPESLPDPWQPSALAGTLDQARRRIDAYVQAGADQINFHFGVLERILTGTSPKDPGPYPWDLSGLDELSAELSLPEV